MQQAQRKEGKKEGKEGSKQGGSSTLEQISSGDPHLNTLGIEPMHRILCTCFQVMLPGNRESSKMTRTFFVGFVIKHCLCEVGFGRSSQPPQLAAANCL